MQEPHSLTSPCISSSLMLASNPSRNPTLRIHLPSFTLLLPAPLPSLPPLSQRKFCGYGARDAWNIDLGERQGPTPISTSSGARPSTRSSSTPISSPTLGARMTETHLPQIFPARAPAARQESGVDPTVGASGCIKYWNSEGIPSTRALCAPRVLHLVPRPTCCALSPPPRTPRPLARTTTHRLRTELYSQARDRATAPTERVQSSEWVWSTARTLYGCRHVARGAVG
ncbi:hypothetical protein DFH06DRAFT_1473445 [Mycena polygramma]|nr:hypothetical protein DFH06DRAFT_1473445 [Mycena polygramma]